MLRSARNSSLSSKRVLLVADSRRADRIAEQLRRYDLVDVDVVRDGQETIDYLLRSAAYAQRAPSEPVLILLDLGSADAAARQLLQRLKSEPRTKTTPVVMLASSDLARDVTAGYDLGANAYVVKPTASSELAETIAEVARFWLGVNRPRP